MSMERRRHENCSWRSSWRGVLPGDAPGTTIPTRCVAPTPSRVRRRRAAVYYWRGVVRHLHTRAVGGARQLVSGKTVVT